MLIYYDPNTTEILHTLDVYPENSDFWPAGSKIEVPDGTVVKPITSFRVVNGELVHVSLDPDRKEGRDEVNQTIGLIREQFITPISGQEMIYQAKEAEAIEFLAQSPEPTDLTPYPFLAGEIGVTGSTAYEVAQTYLNLAAQWRMIGSQLEQLRISTNSALEQAQSVAEITAIMTTFRTQVGPYL